jgi:hypothetical protein
MPNLIFKLNDHLYLRDPQHTPLGQNIVRVSIEMIDRLGFEQFTFKKLPSTATLKTNTGCCFT